MNPPDMILHVVDPTEHLSTAVPFTNHTRIMFCLVASTILLTAEPILCGLSTLLVPTEQILPVAVEMLSQITSPLEEKL